MKLLEMVKDIKVKYSVSSPQKSMGGLFSIFFFWGGGGGGRGCFTGGLISDHARREDGRIMEEYLQE